MPRYFIEVAYMGTRYSGFQIQLNANTIQAEITRALQTFYKQAFELTGSSRTDAGVHALQNFFHFDCNIQVDRSAIYSLNALLPYDIVVKNIFHVEDDAHCRFDAISRMYQYNIIRQKDPFNFGRAYYYPFTINTQLLHETAKLIMQFTDFTSFSKKKTQVKSFTCNIQLSNWKIEDGTLHYEIKADRFLRGMVKGLVGTMLRIAKTDKPASEIKNIIEQKNVAVADFSPPSTGLFLTKVEFKKSLRLNAIS
jgi:tRNA pseudouridine38-40 synthase